MKEKDIIFLFEEIVKSASTPPFLLKGIGDDAAVFTINEKDCLLVTTDLMVEDVHFVKDWMPPFALGYKSLAISLSDIAAMGGRPEMFTLSIGLSPDLESDYIFQFKEGLKSIALKYNVTLIGGDTVSSEKIVINTMVIGRAKKERLLLRSQARVGDIVLVSGCLGEAAAGLELLKKGIKRPAWDGLIKAHLLPEPEVSLAQTLASSDLVHTAIDISDGIATDLAWICRQSQVGARVYQEKLPISLACKEAAMFLQIDPILWALRGGEDYKLLFTAPPETVPKLKKLAWEKCKKDIFVIGEIIEGNRVILVTPQEEIDITGKGYEHFG
jgi:thiamine-monophosphate kinase